MPEISTELTNKLQLTLAKELPELISWYDDNTYYGFQWKDTLQPITSREWDNIVKECIKKLTQEQQQDYFYALNDEAGLVNSTSPAWIREFAVVSLVISSWQAQAIAYFKSKPKTLTERRLEILKWEKENRTLKNRSVIPRQTNVDQCFYHLEEKPGCAVGRLLEPLTAIMLPNLPVERVFNELPVEVQELGLGFLEEIQSFHDARELYTETGLSEKGKILMEVLENTYKKQQ